MTRVVNLTTFPVAYREPNANEQMRFLLFVRAESEDGLVGWGEAVTQFGPPTRATAALVEGLADLVVGCSALDTLSIWQTLRNATWWYGCRGGLVAFAISAIDLALWDLKGKALGQPLATLLGGPQRTRLPAIAATITADRPLEEEAEWHASIVRDGPYGGPSRSGSEGVSALRSEPTRSWTLNSWL
jgi:L-alanine-DL-glutamate epimerase-like enolase superfamily enzyme